MMDKIYIIECFLDYLKSGDKSPATVSSYRSDLYLFSKWFEETNHEILAAIKVTPTDLRKYKKYLIDFPMKPKTINRKITVVKLFVNWMWDSGKLKQRFPLPKLVNEVVPAPQWLDKNQQHLMLRHIEQYANERDSAIIKFLLNTGLRVNEFCSLKWTDIKMTDRKGLITIRHSKVSKYRSIPLNKDARSALEKLNYAEHKDQDCLVLQGKRGPLTVRGIQKVLQRRLAYTEFESVSPHILRHTFCKNLVDAGVSLEKIAMLAGHESLDTTRLYCQPSIGDLTEAVELIGEEE